MIPVADLKAQYLEIKDELDAAVSETLADAHFILGPNVAALESEVAAYCDTRFGIGVASGTDALHLALRALNIGPGDEVVTTPFTFIATAEAISYVGATPVFVDIDPITFNIDPGRLEAAIGPRTRAILPVHLYGQPADMDEIGAIANEHKLAVIEDCAQAIGATYRGRKAGSFGAFGCLSFFPSKNLGGAGDGGMLVTGDEQLAARVRRLRAHGSSRKYYHEEIGYNSRLDELQATIVRVKLRHLDTWTRRRQEIAALYDSRLSENNGIALPVTGDDHTHVRHQYTIKIHDRDRVKTELTEHGIDSAIHYPLPIHLQPAYAYLGRRAGDFPVSERAAAEVLSLPMYPQLADAQVERICADLLNILQATTAKRR